jgi:hypothetical protein
VRPSRAGSELKDLIVLTPRTPSLPVPERTIPTLRSRYSSAMDLNKMSTGSTSPAPRSDKRRAPSATLNTFLGGMRKTAFGANGIPSSAAQTGMLVCFARSGTM